MIMKNASFNAGGETVSLSMDICKVDQEQRLVHGWATLDNLDRQNDVVLATASQGAFSRFRGNIREMHERIAAGKLVSYRPQVFKSEGGKAYNGIFVSAYISKGAQPTWEKVLDGTLSAFSIKGPILRHEVKYDPETGKSYREIQEYELEELSLVDSGGNQLADVVLVQKSDDGSLEGMYKGLKVENVFLCEIDKVAETSSDEVLQCQNGHDMKNVGWVESGEAKMEKVMEFVDNYFKQAEGGVEEVADEVVEKAVDIDEAGTETEVTEEVVKSEEVATEEVIEKSGEEESAAEDETEEVEETVNEAEEQPGAAEEAEASFAEYAEQFLEKVSTVIAEKFASLEETITKRLDEADSKIEEAVKSVGEVKEELGEVSKSVDGLEGETALKKSGDLGGSTEPVKKAGVWQGSIL